MKIREYQKLAQNTKSEMFHLQMKDDESQLTNVDDALDNGLQIDPEFADMVHASFGFVTEAGEFLDVFKKAMFYGKRIDRVNLIEELGDIMWYVAIAATALNISIEEVCGINHRKLATRFPNKFTQHHAETRDLAAERSVLENGLGE